jgi:diadenosine tetraphosphatase ApaH/serine/threonine PP2A family protein phosphatase
MLTEEGALEQFARMTVSSSFVGHTHIPLVIAARARWRRLSAHQPRDGERIQLGKQRLIINPGSVGQPRDGDPRAAYAIFDRDERTVECFRVPYAIESTQSLMEAAGLPPRLISRLSVGR